MSRQGWNNLLRVAGVLLGIGLMVASWYFSASYFGIKKQSMFWLGILVSVVVTFVEFAWRKPGLSGNKTFKLIGVVCYIYDIITNTLGVEEAWGITSNYFSDFMSLFMAFLVGCIFAVIAEPLLSWGITGDAQADVLGGFIKVFNGDNTPDGEETGSGFSGNDQRSRSPIRPSASMHNEPSGIYGFPPTEPLPMKPPTGKSHREYFQGLGNNSNGQKRPR